MNRSWWRRPSLDRPEKRNTLNVEMLGTLAAALEAASSDPGVRCMVLSGNERALCAGTNITEMCSTWATSYRCLR
jgi:enoyl-CoA hydratase/carnithine racemase